MGNVWESRSIFIRANYWKDLDDPWQYLHRRIQKPLFRIREFGVEIHTITTKMQKMYDFLQLLPILGEAEIGKNKVPKEYTISDRMNEVEPEESIKLNYFGTELSSRLLEKIKNIGKDQEDIKIKLGVSTCNLAVPDMHRGFFRALLNSPRNGYLVVAIVLLPQKLK